MRFGVGNPGVVFAVDHGGKAPQRREHVEALVDLWQDHAGHHHFLSFFGRGLVILVELGFMTNPVEDRALARPAVRQRAAVGLCSGTLRVLGLSPARCR